MINDRIREIIDYYQLNVSSFSNEIGLENNVTIGNIVSGRRSKPSFDVILKILNAFPQVSERWLIKGEGAMLSNDNNVSPEINMIGVKEAYELAFTQNKNANHFAKLENGQWLMTMPLAEYSIQAGLLDHYQDLVYLEGLTKHSIIVDEPVKGRYIAFRVKGDSMDSGTSDAILPDSIVTTRELQRQHWKSPIRVKDFPYWVIYTTQARYPLLKQIVEHDTAAGTITCHSLNDGPEYQDFTLSLNDVQALFYVVDVYKQISRKMNY